MTSLQKERAQDIVVAMCLLPFMLVLSPVLVLVYWWGVVTDSWRDAQYRQARNEYLGQQAACEARAVKELRFSAFEKKQRLT